MSNNENGSRIVAALIGAMAMIIAAIIGYFGIRYQTEKPIYATLTALTPTVEVRSTVVVVTMNSPRFTIDNKLIRPINIWVDDDIVGKVDARSSKVFLMESYPIKVEWEVIKQTTSEGTELGDEMGGIFETVYDNEIKTVDNVIDDDWYFYPIITNNTDKDCAITINESWQHEYVTNASVSAHKDAGVGYFRLFTNSNVFLDCDGEIYWWGIRSGETNGTSFSDLTENGSGVITFTLNP